MNPCAQSGRHSTPSETCVPTHLINLRTCGHFAAERNVVMQKAHLYEAIFLFNHGMDEAVRGLERLKRAPDLDAATVDRTRVLFEAERADMNTHFCNNIEGAESSDA